MAQASQDKVTPKRAEGSEKGTGSLVLYSVWNALHALSITTKSLMEVPLITNTEIESADTVTVPRPRRPRTTARSHPVRRCLRRKESGSEAGLSP